MILGAIVLVLFVILLTVSGGEFNENTGKGTVWWLLTPAAPLIYAVPFSLFCP